MFGFGKKKEKFLQIKVYFDRVDIILIVLDVCI